LNFTTGQNATCVGFGAGEGNTTSNTCFGTNAGKLAQNAVCCFGYLAGESISTAANATVIGILAGSALTTGASNTIIGHHAAVLLVGGASNTCLGYFSGAALTSGSNNTHIGATGGTAINATGTNCTLLGSLADTSVDGLDHASSIGAGVSVTTSSTVQIGRVATDIVKCGSSLYVNATQITDGVGHPVFVGGSAPSAVVGAGAGTGASVSVTGTDAAFLVTLVTGTSTLGVGQILFTLTYSVAWPAGVLPFPLWNAGDGTTSLLTGTSAPFVNTVGRSNVSFAFNSGTVAVTGSTTYNWYFQPRA